MITIIHGTDIASSRKYFLDVKEKHQDAVALDGEKITLTDLIQAFEGGGLFGENKIYFIELMLSKRKKSNELTQIISSLQEYSLTNDIYLWENKELTKSSTSTFKNATVRIFKLPQTLFNFLESIKPGNGKMLIGLFHKALENAEAEMIFFMIVRQIRILLAMTDTTRDEIDELKRMAPWQRGKLQSQAKLFDPNQLKMLYAQFFEIEKRLKTGSLPLTLTQTIDLLLLEI